ncbi:MAG: hypothetical protein CME69_10755 [Halobacteriovorax sp.]|nr:hypothetical protein [Halobacteriovorax sp.]MEE3079152.1 hypothetical protein [Bdellovibrionota bacterium]|tara:strand:- start:1594 stop:1815 length:222 start_codon:yes stop_codon:yes gene_type:complete
MSKCRFCNKEITWMKDGRKNVPVEHDGAVHRCEEMINSRKSFKKVAVNELDPELIKQYEQAINDKAAKTKKKK